MQCCKSLKPNDEVPNKNKQHHFEKQKQTKYTDGHTQPPQNIPVVFVLKIAADPRSNTTQRQPLFNIIIISVFLSVWSGKKKSKKKKRVLTSGKDK